jgi:hypothetical protein
MSGAAWQEIRVGMTKGRVALPFRFDNPDLLFLFLNHNHL